MFTLILLVFAFVLACIAAWQAPADQHYPRLVAAALAFYFLACVLDTNYVSAHLPH